MISLLLTLSISLHPAATKGIADHLADCHRTAMARNFRIHGSVHARLTMGQDGRVRRVVVLKENVKSPLLIRCMKYHLLRQRYPGKKTQDFRFRFPRSTGQSVVWSQDVPINRSLGNGAAARVVLDNASVGAKALSMSILRVARKGRLVSRFHPRAHLFLFAVEGSGQLEWAQNTSKTKYLPVSSGSAVYLPPGTVYRARGTSDPPLVLLAFFTPAGPEAYLSGRLTGTHTVLIPPAGLSMNAKLRPVPGAGMRARYRQVNYSAVGPFKGGPVLSIRGVGVLGIVHAPVKNRLRLTPLAGGEAALFVSQGAGILKSRRGNWPVQPGSGLHFPVAGVYTPKIATVPLYGVWFSTGGKARVDVLRK